MGRTVSRGQQRPKKGARQQRRPWPLVLGAVGLVALLVIVFLLVRWATTPPPPPQSTVSGAQLAGRIAAIQASDLKQVGSGSAKVSFQSISGAPLAGPTGKPEVLYVGAEFCPFCAAERWAIIVSLSRFGSFSGLQTATSSATDVYPNTPTFTFRKASYSSPYLDFVTVEGGDQPPTLNAEQNALVNRYDTNGAIPFVDIANRWAFSGASYDPATIQGSSWSTIVDNLGRPSSPQAQAILGAANQLTTNLCQVTGNQPASACSP
ncbi:MAG: DUF929 family protein [Candidatus Dormibacteraeota bacterium]|nr:DUF929 family protein [Candidatus Dormibacteraeota bacterium]